MIDIKTPYVLFTGDATTPDQAKTATGIATFRPENCVGMHALKNGTHILPSLPLLSIKEAVKKGAKTMVIGLANMGGYISEDWIPVICDALEQGLDIASGLHQTLEDIPKIKDAAQKHQRSLHNVRHYSDPIPAGTGKKRMGKKLLTVGTDCASGKMISALTINNTLNQKGHNSTFRATGQTGILIEGSGISVDAVVADFISGAAELISPESDPETIQVIEGQGSLYHPAYAGVSLGLLHGSQPDYIVMCHDPTREHMRHLPGRPMPDIQTCINLNTQLGKETNPDIRCIGICLNTSKMTPAAASDYKLTLTNKTGYPVVDPIIDGVAPIVNTI